MANRGTKTTNQSLTPDERVKKCGAEIRAALEKYNCQMYAALKIGNAEAPLLEVGGLPIVVKVASV